MVSMAENESFRNKPRWSANKKADAVMRLLRGEKLDVVSRELKVEAHLLAKWRDEFLEAGKAGLKGHKADDDDEAERERKELLGKIGELTMDNDILRAAARKRGLQIPPRKQQ
jgi:transposase-like protein